MGLIHCERDLEIDAASDAVWAILSRFMHINEFAPLIKSVEALTDNENGVGAKRRNHFNDGASSVEEVTEWDSNRMYYKVKLSEMSGIPLHEAYSDVSVTPLENNHAKVTWAVDYRVKLGLLGFTLTQLHMGKMIEDNLKGLAEKVKSK